MSLSPLASFSELTPPGIQTRPAAAPPVMPSGWQCTALLHPYSPPPQNIARPDVPFFQLCVATIGYLENEVLSVQIIGLEYGTWWYKIRPGGTTLSTDQGHTWRPADMGWTLPGTSWLQSGATYFHTGYLNWMKAQKLDWWKQPVPSSNATTWFWFDSEGERAGLPFRLMFGAPPPQPERGDPKQLAVFQNFSFTYFPTFEATKTPIIDRWSPPEIAGFQPGNPDHRRLVVWRPHFAMTTLMTPVDSKSFPLPTVVYYQWEPDGAYRTLTDRAQSTVMSYVFNPESSTSVQQALLFGVAPPGFPPPPPANSGDGFLYTQYKDKSPPTCMSFGFGEEPPYWARIRAVDGTIHACVKNNAALCPDQEAVIISVLFPPTQEYPQGRYLWTWYSPFPGSDGTHSRPITFMESASNIAEGGTSLALADYFEYVEFAEPIPPRVFDIPAECRVPAGKSR